MTPDQFPFHEHVSVITGAGSGIGRAVAIALASRDAMVLISDVAQSGLDCTASMIRSASESPRVEAIVADVRSETEVNAMSARALQTFGRIDSLIACAGILRMKNTLPKPLAGLSTDEWDVVIDTNLRGMFLTVRAVLPSMIERRRGQIITISSTAGKQGRAHDAAYCASKFGVIGLTESVAEEVRPYGVKVMTVIPDAVATPFWEQNGPIPCPPDALAPERIAQFILYLLAMPDDAMLVSPVIAPFRTRKRIRRQEAAAE